MSRYRKLIEEYPSLELFNGVSPDSVEYLLEQCHRIDVAEGELLISPSHWVWHRLPPA